MTHRRAQIATILLKTTGEALLAAAAVFGLGYGGMRLAEIRQAEPLRPDENDTVRLTVRHSDWSGNTTFVEVGKYDGAWQCEGLWDIQWLFAIERPGDYDVNVEVACPGSQAGDDFEVRIGDHRLTGRVPDTGGELNWQTVRLGPVRLDARSYRLTVLPADQRTGAAMTLKSVAIQLVGSGPPATAAPAAGDGRAVKLAITPDGRLLLNGRPYFFIGFAPGPPIDLTTPEGTDGWAEMAEGGMMVVRGGVSYENWMPEAEEQFGRYLDVAHEHGVFVWPFLRELVEVNRPGMRERLTAFIKKYRHHPGILFWKSADEPEWGKLPVEPLREAYEIIHQLDPDRLVWFCHAPRGTLETLRPYNVACDVLSTDIYPVSEPPGKHSLEANKGLSMVGDYTRRMVELAEGRKMVFMVLQVAWSGVNPAHNPKNRLMFPTFRQERYMLYQAIINGANSVSFFGMPVALTSRDAELGWNWTFWRTVLKPLLAEIKPGSELYPVLTAPDSTHPLESTGAPQIEVRCKDASVYLYIFAAAREGETVEVRFSGVQDGEVTVLHENRTLEARDGTFTDTFAPHDVHIYRALRGLPPAAAAH